jgi:hypothetical protein
MHDGRLHHARAEALVSRGRLADYEAEFAWSHPDADAGAAGFAILGLDGPFLFEWPMHRGVIEASRIVAVHSPGLMRLLERRWPHWPLAHIALGEGRAELDVGAARGRVRRRLGLPSDAVVFGVFGGLTTEKLVPETLWAFRHTRAWVPDARLLLCGHADPWLDLEQRIAEADLTDAVCRFEAATDNEFDDAIAAVDVQVNLRWPTAYETSGPWVRGLAQGRATIITDLPHQAHVPTLDPRTWKRHAPCSDLSAGADDRAVAVAVDMRDLDRSLRSAMRRLATDAPLRARLGSNARTWWEREHTLARMVGDYERALNRATTEPHRTPEWPSHMRPDPASRARRVLAASGLDTETAAARLAGL